MKKLTFKVSNPKEGSIINLIKDVDKIDCRIQIDFENGFVTAENLNDSLIDTVIELIDDYYTLLGVDINNNVESNAAVPAVAENTEMIAQTESVSEPESTDKIFEPQSEDDLIIEKVEFENEYVEELINKFLRTAYWAMFKMNISERDIGDFIWTSINEISMRYNKKESIPFSIGDIVDCNYGTHLAGEINGGHVAAIVCNISDTGMVYLVPITKTQENLTSHSYLIFNVPNDITYDTRDYVGGTVLLDKGKYVRPERFHEVIGKTSPEFFAKVLHQLATTFDFTNKNAEIEIEHSNKVSDRETVLLETIGFAFDKLDSSKKVEEQIDSFLVEIGMTTSEIMVKQSFVIACEIEKITYDNVILELNNMYPEEKEDAIKATLKENFKKWLEQYPELAEKCPKLSLMSVLKVFAKRFA